MARFYIVFFLFLVFSVLIVMIGHFLIYKYLVKIFGIDNLLVKKIMASFLAFLSISFILSLVLVNSFENFLTRGFYHFTGIWHGLMVYMLLAIFSTWLIAFFLQIFKVESKIISVHVIGLSALAITVGVVVYSIFNALNVDIKTIRPEINHLPSAWKGKKAVQLTDLHLGSTMNVKFLDQVVEKTNRQQADIIFITGDLFDGRADELDIFVPGLNKLEAPLGVFFVTGNHETYIGEDKTMSALEKTAIKVLDDKAIDVAGVNLAGIFYPEARSGKVVLLAQLNKVLEDMPRQPTILLYHEPVQIEELADSGQVDLMLSGHTHRGCATLQQ